MRGIPQDPASFVLYVALWPYCVLCHRLFSDALRLTYVAIGLISMPNETAYHNIRWRYSVLVERVRRALRTQLGDEQQLGIVRSEVESLAVAASYVRASPTISRPASDVHVLLSIESFFLLRSIPPSMTA